MTNPLVSIIIVNYKDYTYLYRCLISTHSYIPSVEIIVIDSESDTAALKKLKDEFKDVNFTEGNNYGIDKSKGDFIFLLNNDTIVEDDWLESLVNEAIKNSRAST